MRQERFILRDFIRLMTCFVENVKEGEILEGFRIDLPAVVEQILPLLLRDFERSPDVLKGAADSAVRGDGSGSSEGKNFPYFRRSTGASGLSAGFCRRCSRRRCT